MENTMRQTLITGFVIIFHASMLYAENQCPKVCSCSSQLKKIICERRSLDTIPENIPTSATSLYLGFNLITHVPKNAFQYLINLQILSLKNNELVKIEDGAFNGLSNLKSLFLTQNSLEELGNGAFEGLKNLNYLYLSQNHLSQVPDLSTLLQLWKLNVDNNKLNTAKISSAKVPQNLTTIVFANNKILTIAKEDMGPLLHSSIHKLDFSRCEIQSVAPGAFANFPKLRGLTMSQNPELNMTAIMSILNDLSTYQSLSSLDFSKTINGLIPKDLFKSLENVPLKHLNLQHSVNCKVLRNGTFQWLKYLEFLDLSKSDIEVVETSAFTGMQNLQRLDMYSTGLKTMPLFPLQNILQMDLSSNSNLKEIDGLSFFLCNKLQQLDMSYCSTEKLHSDAFVGLSKLTHLDLSYNNLASNSIGTKAFTSLENLVHLNLASNKFTEIINEGKIFEALVVLEDLNMANNSCRSLPKDIFKPLTSLKQLTFNNNYLGIILEETPSILHHLTSLERLHIQSNAVNNIPESFVKGLTNLQEIHFNNNKLASWHGSFFNSTKDLKVFNLTNNMISTVNKSSLDGLPKNLHLDLSDNPFDCSCDLIWFREGINNNFNGTNIKVNLSRLSSYKCKSPEKLANHTLLSFNTKSIYKMCFLKPWMWIIVGVGGGILLFFGMISTLLYRKRWPIRLGLYQLGKKCKRKPSGRLGTDPLLSEEEYLPTYDITLSYFDTDSEWVKETLLPKIDKTYGGDYEVFHEDKVEPNLNAAFEVIENMQFSKKKVLVVSNNYVADSRRQFEMDQAINAAIDRGYGLESIILIMLEDSAAVKLPRMLHKLTEKHCELVWTQDDQDGKALFWNRLHDQIRRELPARHLQM